MGISRNPSMTGQTRKLRRAATPEERRLWYSFLSAYPVRFHLQRAVGLYIVDFYCPIAKLIIKVDGVQYYEEKAIDLALKEALV